MTEYDSLAKRLRESEDVIGPDAVRAASRIETLVATLSELVDQVEDAGDWDSQFGVGQSLDNAHRVLEWMDDEV